MIYNYIVRIYPLFRVMEVQRTCEVTATPVEYIGKICERAGRCQPERGVCTVSCMLNRAIRGFEDFLLFSSPQLLRTLFFVKDMCCRNQVTE